MQIKLGELKQIVTEMAEKFWEEGEPEGESCAVKEQKLTVEQLTQLVKEVIEEAKKKGKGKKPFPFWLKKKGKDAAKKTEDKPKAKK